jgi:hypothetical protein
VRLASFSGARLMKDERKFGPISPERACDEERGGIGRLDDGRREIVARAVQLCRAERLVSEPSDDVLNELLDLERGVGNENRRHAP